MPLWCTHGRPSSCFPASWIWPPTSSSSRATVCSRYASRAPHAQPHAPALRLRAPMRAGACGCAPGVPGAAASPQRLCVRPPLPPSIRICRLIGCSQLGTAAAAEGDPPSVGASSAAVPVSCGSSAAGLDAQQDPRSDAPGAHHCPPWGAAQEGQCPYRQGEMPHRAATPHTLLSRDLVRPLVLCYSTHVRCCLARVQPTALSCTLLCCCLLKLVSRTLLSFAL